MTYLANDVLCKQHSSWPCFPGTTENSEPDWLSPIVIMNSGSSKGQLRVFRSVKADYLGNN